MPRTTRPRTLAAQGAEERRKRDSQIMSAQGGGSRAKPKAKNTRTAPTARQRSVVAKRKIASQVSSAPAGRTRLPKGAAQQLKNAGETLVKLATAKDFPAQLLMYPAGVLAKSIQRATTKPKPKPKPNPKGYSPVTPTAAIARDRSRGPKPAAAKPTKVTDAATLKRIENLNPPKKRKAPKYRG